MCFDHTVIAVILPIHAPIGDSQKQDGTTVSATTRYAQRATSTGDRKLLLLRTPEIAVCSAAKSELAPNASDPGACEQVENRASPKLNHEIENQNPHSETIARDRRLLARLRWAI